jgi:rare lipoprotein A
MTAAHKTLPLGSKAKVTNLKNGKSVEVEINDRGPYVEGRIIDLSKAAARALGIVDHGVARVRVELLDKQFAADVVESP